MIPQQFEVHMDLRNEYYVAVPKQPMWRLTTMRAWRNCWWIRTIDRCRCRNTRSIRGDRIPFVNLAECPTPQALPKEAMCTWLAFPKLQASRDNSGNKHNGMLGLQPILLKGHTGWVGDRPGDFLHHVLRHRARYSIVQDGQEPPNYTHVAYQPTTWVYASPIRFPFFFLLLLLLLGAFLHLLLLRMTILLLVMLLRFAAVAGCVGVFRFVVASTHDLPSLFGRRREGIILCHLLAPFPANHIFRHSEVSSPLSLSLPPHLVFRDYFAIPSAMKSGLTQPDCASIHKSFGVWSQW